MAELTHHLPTVGEPTPCCEPTERACCCEPSHKAMCCDPSHGGGCGCAAGQTDPPATDIREQVRLR